MSLSRADGNQTPEEGAPSPGRGRREYSGQRKGLYILISWGHRGGGHVSKLVKLYLTSSRFILCTLDANY